MGHEWAHNRNDNDPQMDDEVVVWQIQDGKAQHNDECNDREIKLGSVCEVIVLDLIRSCIGCASQGLISVSVLIIDSAVPLL